jgi:7,8-dihydropterin-6-yl-methyl-4-(beta-D-ribofuranosyl)aminobenzene 5'-phosphate synthase
VPGEGLHLQTIREAYNGYQSIRSHLSIVKDHYAANVWEEIQPEDGDAVKPMSGLLIVSVALSLACLPQTAGADGATPGRQGEKKVKTLRILVLSTALAGAQSMKGVGEWGFAALAQADDRKFLFDTGSYADTVLRNADELGVNLAGIKDVVLSHNHRDHTGGLLALRTKYVTVTPAAFSQAHVAPGIFWSRPSAYGELNPMIALKPKFENAGGTFVEHAEPTELAPGVWLTGPIPRLHDEHNYGLLTRVRQPDGELMEDTVPENLSMIFDTDEGIVLLTGCGHAGVINELEHGLNITGNGKTLAVVGGLHLYQKSNQDLEWTALMLRRHGLKHFLGAHCTGIEAAYVIRRLAGLDRKSCVVASIGASFTLGKGIDPEALAK